MFIANWIAHKIEVSLYQRQIEHGDIGHLVVRSLASLKWYLRSVMVVFSTVVVVGAYSTYKVADYTEITLWSAILCLMVICGLFLQCMLGHSHANYCQFMANLGDQDRDRTVLDEHILHDIDFLTSVGLVIYGTCIKNRN